MLDTLRARFGTDPSPYEQAWLTSINAVGLLVIIAVIFDLSLLLGSGQTGVFQRALYPLVPPAATLGVAVGTKYRRGIALSVGFALGYAVLLVAVGTAQEALAVAPRYVGAAVVGTVAVVLVGYGASRQRQS